MIPIETISALAIASVCTVLVPIILLIMLGIKRKISALPLLVGALAFFISQILVRIPIISVLSSQSWYQSFATQFILYAFVLSLTAGLFEESARLGGALLLKKHRSYKDIISFGLGHGLCEAILLIGFSYAGSVFLGIAINSGGIISDAIPPEALGTIKAQLLAINHTDVYWGILERVSAVLLHIFATLLVFKGVIEKKIRFYLLAIVVHTLFNFAAVLIFRLAGIVVTEIVLLVSAMALGAYVLRCKSHYSVDIQ